MGSRISSLHRCDKDEIIEHCTELTRAASAITSVPTATSSSNRDSLKAPVGFAFGLTSPLVLTMSSDGTMSAKAQLNYTLQWQDARLATTPCRAVLTDLLSVPASRASANATARTTASSSYWIPFLTWDELSKETFGSSRHYIHVHDVHVVHDVHGMS